MTDTGFTRIDFVGLQGLISDEDIDLHSLSYSEDKQMVSFDAIVAKRDHPRIESKKKHILTVYPIVRQTIRFHNVTSLETRVSRRQSRLLTVTVYCRKEGEIEISACRGKLVIIVSRVQIEVGPEIETEYELLERKLWWGITRHTWRSRQKTSECEKEG
jgi:hypothetical protein